MPGKLNRPCAYCGTDNWWSTDNKTEIIEWCSNPKCLQPVVYKKQNFLNVFRCNECGCTNGILQDNDDNITIVCEKCNTPKVVFKKNYVEIDNRNNIGIIINKPHDEDKIKCPKCRSTQITTSKKGYSLLAGFIGANKTVNRCAKCGHHWTPKL